MERQLEHSNPPIQCMDKRIPDFDNLEFGHEFMEQEESIHLTETKFTANASVIHDNHKQFLVSPMNG